MRTTGPPRWRVPEEVTTALGLPWITGPTEGDGKLTIHQVVAGAKMNVVTFQYTKELQDANKVMNQKKKQYTDGMKAWPLEVSD